MNFKVALSLLAGLFSLSASAAPPTTYTLTPSNGTVTISFTNRYRNSDENGVGTLEGRFDRRWVPLQNFFTTGRIGSVTLPLPEGYSDYRFVHANITPGNAFTRLALVYNEISTVAGTGPTPPGVNLWLPQYEGTIATSVPLSNPRTAVADEAGNIYVVEQDSHAVSVIDVTNGVLRTLIGTSDRQPGGSLDTDEAPPRNDFFPYLRNPSALYYSAGRLYVIDAGNGRIVRYTFATDSVRTLLFNPSNAPIASDSALWVSGDEQNIFFTDGNVLKHWDPANLVTVVASGFVNLSDVKVSPQGQTFVVDRGDNVVWRVNNDGFRTLEAGNGLLRGRSVGRATTIAFSGPSSIAFMPIGGYLLGLDEGARVWYVDAEDNAAPLVFGKPGVHDGDGEWFQKGRRKPKISNVRSVSVAPSGDIIILEGGYVRKIKFLRRLP